MLCFKGSFTKPGANSRVYLRSAKESYFVNQLNLQKETEAQVVPGVNCSKLSYQFPSIVMPLNMTLLHYMTWRLLYINCLFHRVSRWNRNPLRSLDSTKAAGPDSLQAMSAKVSVDIIAPPLSRIFNLLGSGCFPKHWKQASIVPVFEGGSKDDPSCYHLISFAAYNVKDTGIVCIYSTESVYGIKQASASGSIWIQAGPLYPRCHHTLVRSAS